MPRGKGHGKSARAARAMKKREPQVVEGEKSALVMRGLNTSQTVVDIIKDIVSRPCHRLCAQPMRPCVCTR